MLDKSFDCSQVEPLLDAFWDHELSTEENGLVSSHLENCAICKVRLQETELLVGKVSQLPRLALPNNLDYDWDTLIAQKNPPKSPVRFFIGQSPMWTAAALAASVAVLLFGQKLLFQVNDKTIATDSHSKRFGVDKANPNDQEVAFSGKQRPEELIGRPESVKEHLTAPYEDLLAADPAETSSFGEEVGISTDEDGLYALKL